MKSTVETEEILESISIVQGKHSNIPSRKAAPNALGAETEPVDAQKNALLLDNAKDAHITIASATITMNVPSITVVASPFADTTDDSSGSEIEKYKENLCLSFEKFEEQQEKLISSNYEKADSLLLTISSGFLALSLTFIGSLISNKHPLKYLWEVQSGWVALGLTVTFVLLSYFTARKSLFHSVEKARTQKDICILTSDDARHTELQIVLVKHSKKRKISFYWNQGLNIAASCTFVVGIVLIVTFAAMNIK